MVQKDPGLVVLFALVFPGAGQVYNEEFVKAIVLFLAIVLSFILLGPFGFFVGAVIWLFAIWDAYSSAKGA